MAHHKRRRPKNRRAGCLMCKPQKANGSKNREHSTVLRATQDDPEDLVDDFDADEHWCSVDCEEKDSTPK